jgi:hypothetical protein
MSEPWKDEPVIWEAFCREKEWCATCKNKQELFNETRGLKEEYEWFKKGYLTNKE